MSIPSLAVPIAIINTVASLPARSVQGMCSLVCGFTPSLEEIPQIKEKAVRGVIDTKTWVLLDFAWHETIGKRKLLGLSAADIQELMGFRARLDKSEDR